MDFQKWQSFKLVANFNSSIKDIYTAWATSAGIEKWFLRSAIFTNDKGITRSKTDPVQQGDKYAWLWHGFTDDTVEKGGILEANGRDFLKFTFSGGCMVSISISRKEDITLLELTQENITWEDDPGRNLFVQCQTGWVFYLANLKSVTEGGIDLRNKRVDLQTNFK